MEATHPPLLDPDLEFEIAKLKTEILIKKKKYSKLCCYDANLLKTKHRK